MTLHVRAETAADADAVRAVNDVAFGRRDEGALVDSLRGGLAWVPELSLVAVTGDRVVGHALFTRVTVGSHGGAGLGLGPMAVLPPWQRRGVGGALVRHGLVEAERLGFGYVVVVGHPGYYPRFGFEPARPHGLDVKYEVPDEAFMVLALRPGGIPAGGGAVRYADPFDAV